MRWILAICLVLTFSVQASAQLTFSKVEARTGFGLAEEGDKGNLVLDNDTIRLVKKNGMEYFALPTDAVTDMFYSRVSGRRIKSAIFVSPLLLLTKGRKHYVTITFDDPQASGALELKLDKKNYMGVLRSLEQVTGMSMQYEQEGIKDTEQNVAARKRAVLDISSNPEGADIEINGSFKGNTPDLTSLHAGEYTVRVVKAGYEPWERRIVRWTRASPTFSERGTLFGGQLRLRVGFGVLLAGERLQGAVFPFSKGALSRSRRPCSGRRVAEAWGFG